MFANFLYLLVALIIYSSAGLFEGTIVSHGSTLMVSLMTNILFVLVVQAGFRRLRAKGEQLSSGRLEHAANKYITRFSILALIFFAVHVFGFRLQLYFKEMAVFNLVPTLGAMLFLTLFYFYLIVVWEAAYGVLRPVYQGRVTKKEYIRSNFYFSLPALIPWFCLSVVADILRLLPFKPLQAFLNTAWGELTYLGLFILVITVYAPVLIKRLWSCRPLEQGPDRQKIEMICDRVGLKYADILKWELFGGHMITAGVMGLLGRYRYILVTPALLNSLNDDELEAVILHEIGHVQRHHMVYYLLFFLGFIVCNIFYFEPVRLLIWVGMPYFSFLEVIGIDQGSAYDIINALFLIGIFLVYFRFVFGVYMRNFERQADLHVYAHGKTAGPMISTFYKIAAYSRQSMDKPNWHHYSIGERIRFLQRCMEFPDLIRKHHRKVAGLIGAYFAAMIVVIYSGYAISYGWAQEPFVDFISARQLKIAQTEYDPEKSELYAYIGSYFYDKKDYGKAVQAYKITLQVDPDNITALNNLSWLYSTCEDESYRNYEQALVLAKRALEQRKESFIWDTYAEALFVNQDYEGALIAAKVAIQKAKTNRKHYIEQLERFHKALKEKGGG